MLMPVGIMRCAEQAEPRERGGRVVVMQDTHAQEDLPPDGITPITSPDDLWAQLPEGKRGRGWTEPLILDDSDDPSKLARTMANWISPPARVTVYLVAFVRNYSEVVADYCERHQAQENALCGQIDGKGNPVQAAAHVPEEVQTVLAAEFGWSLDHARDLRRAALAIFLQRTQGLHPAISDVRLVRGAKDRRQQSVVDSVG